MTAPAAHTTRAHAKLAPSAAHRWLVCPGSIRMSEDIPNRSTSFANEGSAAHELASKCLTDGKDAADFYGWLINVEPAEGKTPFDPPEKCNEPANGETTFDVDDDMAEAVQEYLDHVRGIYGDADAALMSVEERLDMTDLHPGIFGTGDATVFVHATRTLHVIDFKFGKGVAVTADQNPQLMLYGAGAARRHHNLPVEKIALHIVQPRAPHGDGRIRTYETDVLELLEFEDTIREAALATEAPGAPLAAGEHCRFCPAAAICPEHRRHALALAEIEFSDTGELVLPAPETMTAEQIGKTLHAADLISNWIKAVQQHAHDQALAGNMPAGFKLVAKRAIRKWKEGDDVLDVLQIDFGIAEEELYERKLRSPAKLERMFPGKNAKQRQSAMEPLVIKESSGTNLVPKGDPRPAVKVDAASEFGAE
ncbi:DUF2800 domain-containing protein [Aurantimonas sp. A2-1-M11]|uniref:DUF2800 domain-containing protein n=1 Tax=Aurantimonas sp. A2-1-M11 TaxID=3113712 RepID=UPI002F957C9F